LERRWYKNNFLFHSNLAAEDTDEARNTPAGNHWTLGVQFIRSNESVLSNGTTVPVVFLPTGEIDFTRTSTDDLSTLNTILSPTISLLDELASASGVELDFWRLINWIYVNAYWTILSNLGQYSPTLYYDTVDSDTRVTIPDFSTAIQYPSTNNIFVNNSLYDVYSTFTLYTVFPLLGVSTSPAGVAPLDASNGLAFNETVFRASYFCTVRTLKSPFVAIVSVLVAEYAFIHGAYSLFMLLAARYQKRKISDGMHLVLLD